jgi:hypothetical protein
MDWILIHYLDELRLQRVKEIIAVCCKNHMKTHKYKIHDVREFSGRCDDIFEQYSNGVCGGKWKRAE